MSEVSRFWNTNGVGDGGAGGYAQGVIDGWLRVIFGRGGDGILKATLTELLVISAGGRVLRVYDGAALVDGKFYINSALIDITIDIPYDGTTGGRIVLEADWTAQTVRAKKVMNTDGNPAIPALVQISGTTYQVNLATFQITTGGTILNLSPELGRLEFSNSPRAGNFYLAGYSVLGNSDEDAGRGVEITADYEGQALRWSYGEMRFGQIRTAGIADLAVTREKLYEELEVLAGQIADGAVGTLQLDGHSVDDTKVGDRVPQLYRRQGGSSASWLTAGANNYIPGRVRIQAGVIDIAITSGYGAGYNITLPVAMANPILFVTVQNVSPERGDIYIVGAYALAISSTMIQLWVKRSQSFTDGVSVTVAWMAIGAE